MAPQDKKIKTPTRVAASSKLQQKNMKAKVTVKSEKNISNQVANKTPLKVITNINDGAKQQGTPQSVKSKSNLTETTPGRVKPAWKRKPPNAHSGVPVPEKMRKLFEKLQRERQAAAEANASESVP